MSIPDYLQLSLSELGALLKSRDLSPVEVTEASLRLIDAKNPEVNAYVTIMADEALAAARQAEQEIQTGKYKGPLHGVPVGVKDAIFTKGVATTFGSETHRNFIAQEDAEVVTRLRQAGAVILGKTNMQGFALGPTGDKSCFGPVLNPRAPGMITGGSSSGNAGALASHQCFGTVGSDTGGSVRMPASACGLVGMKPTFGKVSKHGALPLCWTLDHLGPMTRTVKDNALMLNVLAGFDVKDAYSVPTAIQDYAAGIDASVSGKVIGVPVNFYFDIVEAEVQEIFDSTVERLRHQGCRIEPVTLPEMDDLLVVQQIVFACESYSTMKKYLQQCPEKIDQEIRNRGIAGLLLQSGDYIEMLQLRHRLIRQQYQSMAGVDALLTPTLPILPSKVGQRDVLIDGKPGHTRILSKLTGPSNTTGFPAISVPGGVSSDGRPVGVQLIGKPNSEAQLYNLAYAIEQYA
jgi:aspartyl-tRNA(Asn)/glutamyl-tRNA(Gln) amidotransferase subunit A